jgi:AcrR family transcriptional regulator
MDLFKTRYTVLDQIIAADKVRRKIIDAASTLYAKKGYAGTSIEQIAEMAGVSLPVTYHYVKKKSEIMKLIMEDLLSTFRESLTSHLSSIHDPEEKLGAAVILFCEAVDQQREKILLIYQKSGSLDAASKAKIMQLEVEVSEIFGGIIKEGIEAGLFREVDVDVMAFNIIMMAHMWVLKKWHLKRRLGLEKFIELQLATILGALRK